MLKAKIKKRGGSKIQREIDKLTKISRQPQQVKVGIPAGGLNYPDGTSLVMVAAVNEFGSFDGRIPERSYLRSTVVNKRDVFRAFWRADKAKEILTVEEDANTVLDLLGQLAQAEVQKTIVDIREPPNAPETIERKGSSNPLVDEGLLRQSIRYEVDK